MWCTHEELLCSMYHLQHTSQSTSQDVDCIINGFIPLLQLFIRTLKDENICKAIRSLDLEYIQWEPKYAAAILCLPTTDGELHVSVIGLDNWCFRIHSSPEHRKRAAYSTGYSIEFVGNTGLSYDELMNRFNIILKKRSALNNRQGHHKTPSFIYAILSDSIKDNPMEEILASPTPPPGGFSDVGLHTGGEPRDTIWHLVTSVIQVLLESTQDAKARFQRSMSLFDLWLAELQADLVLKRQLAPKYINATMQMLRSAVQRGIMNDEDFADRCLKVRNILEISIGKVTWSVYEGITQTENININLDGEKIYRDRVSLSLEETRIKADRNLDILLLLEPTPTFQEAVKWVKSHQIQEQTDLSKELIAYSIENLLFKSSKSLVNTTICECESIEESNALNELMTKYQSLDDSAASKSRRMLVIWIAYCLTFKAASKVHPLLQKYGVALRHSDLRHLVLGDKLANGAACNVCLYLNGRIDRPIFNPMKPNHTFDLAAKYGQNDVKMMRRWKCEKVKSAEKDKKYWAEVESKKEYIDELKNDLGIWKDELVIMVKCNNYQEQNRLRTQMLEREKLIRQVAIPPDRIYHPLPLNRDQAMIVIFFLFMPSHFVVLGRITYLAQMQILPAAEKQKTIIKDLKTHWTDYHNSYCYYSKGTEPPVSLLSKIEKTPYNKLGPRDVRDCTQNENGIYYPDPLTPTFSSNIEENGRLSYNYFNPFIRAQDQTISTLYTAKLANQKLQWAMVQYGPETQKTPETEKIQQTRGNMGIARQDLRPREHTYYFSKPQYLALTRIRAYPLTQIRELCTTLRMLSLGDPDTQILIRQTLYQIGEIQCKPKPKFMWKRDFYEGDARKILCEELTLLADKIKDAPRENESVPLLGEIAGYISQWYPYALGIRRRFANMVEQWAKNLNEEIKKAPPQHLPKLYEKQSTFYKYSVLCHRYGAYNEEDIEQIVMNTVAARNHNIVYRIQEVADGCMKNPAILTKAVKTQLSFTPSTLPWEYKSLYNKSYNNTSCFHAVVNKKNLYSINVMTGLVLYNGDPPAQLPNDVLYHPLYKRCFGKQNFLTCIEQGTIKTVMPTDNYMYKFTIADKGKRLFIQETEEIEIENNGIKTTNKITLELLDPSRIETWAPNLPIRLKELYSHWYCREHKKLIFRPISFQKRDIKFMYDLTYCWRVPLHERDKHWLKQEIGNDKLILTNQNIFKQIENKELVHVFKTDSSHKFILPRFKLEFEDRGDNIIRSLNYIGFSLSKNQQLEDTLLNFNQYLVLEKDKQIKVLIPNGIVTRTENCVKINIDKEIKANIEHRMYDVHQRFKNLKATSVGARLQLAALYAATGILLPDRRLGITGGEAAMELVRQSWVNRPLNNDEKSQLLSVAHLSFLTPAVVLLCYDIDKEIEISNAASEYLNKDDLNTPSLLTYEEESRILGQHRRMKPQYFTEPIIKWNRQSELDDYLNILKEKLLISKINSKYHGLTFIEICSKFFYIRHSRNFPLIGDSNSRIGEELLEELKKSWEEYHKGDKYLLNKKYNSNDFKEMSKKVKELIKEGEEELRIENQSSIYQIRKAANLVHKRTVRNLLDTETLPTFLKKQAMVWQQLCVLEDKLERLINYQEEESKIRELSIWRDWDVDKYPLWLAFEAEQQIQIRPDQSMIAQFLITYPGSTQIPGSIVQMNMGEGKTRVILPMLALHWANGQNLVRLNFLSPLLSEAYEYLHGILCASIFHRKLFLMSFNREMDIKKSKKRESYINTLKYCLRTKGILLVAPEHRLSLILKNKDEGWTDFEEKFKSFPYVDVLDESDELLHFKYQLVYAVDEHRLLPSGEIRWCVWQVLFDAIRDDEIIKSLLQNAITTEFNSNRIYQEIRIISGKAYDNVKEAFLQRLALYLFTNPPHEFRWLKKEVWKGRVDQMVDAVTIAKELDPIFSDSNLRVEEKEMLLALRGLLAFGILEYCLQQRHRVNYGVCRPGKKQLAIPFKASNVPSERAEFAHPDCALGLTMLAYYYDGLAEHELKQAINKLQTLGLNQQKAIYDHWIYIYRKNERIDNLDDIDSCSKLDLTNAVQFEFLYFCYKYNPPAINFWLNNCVLPRETMQFSHRLSTNAFHLADNSTERVVGFSGTNDSPMLLPPQVTQKQLFLATNGKMLSLILNNPECICIGENSTKPHWEEILDICFEKGANAIMDAGALFAGKTDEAIIYITKRIPVVYFEDNEWKIKNKEGQTWPKHRSPILEQDAFVFFDESHCRGADMKLLPKALAMLTLGPNMCKSKFMQAAGRMRQLDKKQKIIFIATKEISTKIRYTNKLDTNMRINSNHIIEWVTENTIEASSAGLAQWATHGMDFAKDKKIPDMVELGDLYEHSIQNTLMSETCENIIGDFEHPMVSKISERVQLYGKDFKGRSTLLGEECERELEREIEAEEEQELEIAKKDPRAETNWDMNLIFNVGSPRELPNANLLQDTINIICPKVNHVLWDKTIFCTRNFAYTVVHTSKSYILNNYLRPVDFLLIFKNKEILLISEREANTILPALWGRKESKVSLQHILYAEEGKQLSLHHSMGRKMPVLKLFNGETAFPISTSGEIEKCLPDEKAKNAAKMIVQLRGYQSMIPHSTLDDICAK